MTDDDQILADLRRVLDVVDAAETSDNTAAKAAFAWREIDADLAELVFDSEQHEAPPGVVLRGDGTTARQLTFSTDQVTIDLEISEGRLIGQILPPQSARLELHCVGHETVHLATDDFGVFAIELIESGPTTVLAQAADGTWSVRTAWIAA